MSHDAASASPCIRELAAPALHAVRDHLRATTRYDVEVTASARQVELIVSDREGDTFRYGLAGCAAGVANGVANGVDGPADCAGLQVSGSDGERRLPCAQCTVEKIRDDCLEVCHHWLLC